jgi:hypothetical protein
MGNRSALRADSGLLSILRDEDFALIEPHLRHEVRETGALLYRPGDNVERVFFPLGPSVVAFVVQHMDAREVETVLVGREGAVGGIVSSGFLPAFCVMMVKFGGPFLMVPVARVEDAKGQSASFHRVFSRYADCLMAQMFQGVACNACHSIEQRAAKWILASIDRTGSDVVPLHQQGLASLLGVGRSYTSRVLQTLKSDGVVDLRRGQIAVQDKDELALRSCGCNDTVKAHFDVVLRGVYPDGN